MIARSARLFGAILAFAAAAFAADPSAEKKGGSLSPNIVLIFCDDLAYADIEPFGGTIPTPNLSRMAAEGRKLTNFHVPSPVCSASRASLLTGCYNSRVGIHGALGPEAKTGLNPAESTIAEVLRQGGYATGMVGKWHLGRPEALLPTAQGFDEYFGLPYSNDMWPKHPEAKAGAYPALPLIEGIEVLETLDDQSQLTTRYTGRAVSFIDKNHARPFFLYLAHNMPHVPLFVSDRFKGRSGKGLFGDVIMEIDWSVGQVFDALKRHGIDDNTLVIFTSDNGPWLSYGEHAGSAGPLREGKGTCWEGGLRVPCLLRWPGKIPAGSASDVMQMSIDVLPTLAEIAQVPLPEQPIDGLNVLPLWTGAANAKNPHESYCFYYENNQLQAVSDLHHKLQLPHSYRTMGDQPKARDGIPGRYRQVKLEKAELYDLDTDIGEKTDLSAQRPEVLQKLEKLAEAARTSFGDSLTQRKGNAVREPGRVP